MQLRARAGRLVFFFVLFLMVSGAACGPAPAPTAGAAGSSRGAPSETLVPPPFAVRGGQAVPIDIARLDIQYEFDVAADAAKAVATIVFQSLSDGLPLVDLWPDAKDLVLDGEPLPLASLRRVDLPGGTGQMRLLDQALTAGEDHTLRVAYDLPASVFTKTATGVDFRFSMCDIEDECTAPYYLERYALANFEFDQFPINLVVTVKGTQKAHRLFVNGAAEELVPGLSWRVAFPAYFTSSSPYLHLTERAVAVEHAAFSGRERTVPVTVYGDTEALAHDNLPRALATLAELEADYGPYPHAAMLLYVTNSLHDDGMEADGAAITDPLALPHEITHSWFGRSVMPGNGNAGWIDEAIASWRDQGYPRRRAKPSQGAPGLGAGSPYRRATSSDAYSVGAELLAYLDEDLHQKGQPGIKAALARLFHARRNSVISTPFFQKFLEQETGLDLKASFDAVIYNALGIVRPLSRHSKHRL